MKTKISPNFSDDYLNQSSMDKRIDVLADRINCWFLDWAEKINDEEHAGFAVLHLCFSYFELYAQLELGEDSDKQAKNFFIIGFSSVFPEIEKLQIDYKTSMLNLLYKNARCGFFHSGMAKKGVILFDHDEAITFQSNNILIDRYKFLKAIRDHFNNYLQKLRSDNDPKLTESFEKAWNIFHF